MATLTLTWDYRVTINGRDYVFASPVAAPTVTLTELFESTRTLGATLSLSVWAAGTAGHPASFDFFYFLATKDCLIEFTCNTGDANDRVFAVPAKANLPFILFRDDSTFNYTATADAFAGTADVIDTIRVKNVSADTATIQVVVGMT